jgi:hypothetical protein
MIDFIHIFLEDNLYDMTIYGKHPNTEVNDTLGMCILTVLLNGIDKAKGATRIPKKRFEKMINIINSFIIKFNENNKTNINEISSNIDINDGVATISNKQKREVLNLIRNQKFMSIISNLNILPNINDDTKTKHIASIKEFQEKFKKLKDDYSSS